MTSSTVALGREQMLQMFADWTDRIAQGEVPSKPQRPQGVERNVVISQWDWADPKPTCTMWCQSIEETQQRMRTVCYTVPRS